VLKQADGFGLSEKEYSIKFIESVANGFTKMPLAADSVEAEIKITSVALHFFSDIAYGNTKPSFGYNGLKMNDKCRNVPALLAEYISRNELSQLVTKLSAGLSEINIVEKKIQYFLRVIADSTFRDINISSAKVTGTNLPLILKLFYLGFIDSLKYNFTDSIVKIKVKEAQLSFDLLNDGVLRKTILEALNIPIAQRLQQLQLAINYYRWLYCVMQNQPVIVVNIPAANLKVYRQNTVILNMRIIVGKRSTPTPTLASTVNEVILYPYWHVPNSIATKELLPLIKRNPGYINTGNYQVLNNSGRIVNPYSINWHALSRSYFPYTIRQSTGCDNSLGLLKLNFYNPFGVYLHDTPSKSLFALKKRFFSHGCMRMEKPMEIGHLVLKDNFIAIDTLEQKGCLINQSPITVNADVPMPVIVWYNPVSVDIATGRVIFYEDVYNKFDW
jgi:hypothetical protein